MFGRRRAPHPDGSCSGPAGIEELDALLDACREQPGRREPSLDALIAAAECAGDEWRVQHRRVVEARTRLEAEQDAERVARERLRRVVEVIDSLPPLPASSAVPGFGVADDPPSLEAAQASHPSASASAPARAGEPDELSHGGVETDQGSVEDLAVPAERTAVGAAMLGGGQADLEIRLFGPLAVRLHGAFIHPELHGKALRLFQYLLAHHDRPTPRDVLIEQFWSESDLDAGRRALHQAIYTVRKAIRRECPDAQVIAYDREAYRIDPRLEVWRDVDEFEERYGSGRLAETAGDDDAAMRAYDLAERLRIGEYLEDAPYEGWACAERDRLRLTYVEVANRLGDLLERRGRLDAAGDVSQRVLAVEACDEASTRRIMRCHAARGHRQLAICDYRSHVAELERVYGLAPSAETTALYESLTSE